MQKEILMLGDERLYQISDPVRPEETASLEWVAEDLRDTLLAFRERYGTGRAIAAPQIGVQKRLIYVHTDAPFAPAVLFNPQLTFPDAETMPVLDDCMSFPHLLVRIQRFKRCVLRWRDATWAEHEALLEGGLAELLQHECDHLDGILATMRATNEKSFIAKV